MDVGAVLVARIAKYLHHSENIDVACSRFSCRVLVGAQNSLTDDWLNSCDRDRRCLELAG